MSTQVFHTETSASEAPVNLVTAKEANEYYLAAEAKRLEHQQEFEFMVAARSTLTINALLRQINSEVIKAAEAATRSVKVTFRNADRQENKAVLNRVALLVHELVGDELQRVGYTNIGIEVNNGGTADQTITINFKL
jgi:hypothetical protein